MTYKCLHFRTCKSYVTFVDGKGWVHTPSQSAYWMEHFRYSKKRLKNSQLYNFGMDGKNGCGWKGAAPADEITYATDICPNCGAQGELGDNHIASPVYPKKRGRKTKGVISKKLLKTMRKQALGCNVKCRTAQSNDCNCMCHGANHGASFTMPMFINL